MHMADELYDIAVVGGGLAGLSVALQSAKAGYRTILFEKEQYPFHKVCGEYISMESWDFLNRIGVPLGELNLPIINKLLVSDGRGRRYNFKLPLGGFGISRYMLDNLLFQQAVNAGVMVHTGTKVNDIIEEQGGFTVMTVGSHFKARLAIGGFGKRSNLDVKWKRNFTLQKPGSADNFIGVKYHIRYPHPVDEIALHNFSNGYCGMSKVENDISCLCYLTTAANLQRSNNSIREMERNILFKNPVLRQIFSTAEFLYEQPLTISQVNFHKKEQVENHVIMLGDSAGLISPLCGNGMSMALHSSSIAFSLVRKYFEHQLTRNQLAAAYKSTWSRNFSNRLWVGRQVQRFFGGDKSTAMFLKAMDWFPPVAGMIIDKTHGAPF